MPQGLHKDLLMGVLEEQMAGGVSWGSGSLSLGTSLAWLGSGKMDLWFPQISSSAPVDERELILGHGDEPW